MDLGCARTPTTIAEVEEPRFGTGRPFSLGIEEELFLVNPVTGVERDTSAEVVARAVPPPRGTLSPELHASQIELISDVCRTAAEAVGVLRDLRATAAATGTGLLGSGTHPMTEEGRTGVTPKERYRRIHELLGDTAATPVAGLHVHIGMPDTEATVRAFNGLRRHLPLLQALGANSPFRHGRDTGLASSREVTMAAWPRSGVPGALSSWDEFVERTAVICRAAAVPDYTYFWWKLRPHPRLGTVELRAMDVQTDPDDTASLAALVHVLAVLAADRPAPPTEPAAEVLHEGGFRAARFGTGATLPDEDGYLRPVPDLLGEVLRDAAPYARELGCEGELARLPDLVRDGGPAARQRRLEHELGIDGLCVELARATVSAGGSPRGRQVPTATAR